MTEVMTKSRDRTNGAAVETHIWIPLLVGLGLQVGGLILVAAPWPSTKVSDTCKLLASGTCASEKHGSATAVVIGYGLAGIGSLAVLFAVIVWAVLSALRIHESD